MNYYAPKRWSLTNQPIHVCIAANNTLQELRKKKLKSAPTRCAFTRFDICRCICILKRYVGQSEHRKAYTCLYVFVGMLLLNEETKCKVRLMVDGIYGVRVHN